MRVASGLGGSLCGRGSPLVRTSLAGIWRQGGHPGPSHRVFGSGASSDYRLRTLLDSRYSSQDWLDYLLATLYPTQDSANRKGVGTDTAHLLKTGQRDRGREQSLTGSREAHGDSEYVCGAATIECAYSDGTGE